jgi:hypothetical protein
MTTRRIKPKRKRILGAESYSPRMIMRRFFILLAAFAPLATGLARPAQVILLRHAEKPANESEHHLSERGRMRARALAFCLTTNAVLLTNGPPAAVFAPKFTRDGTAPRPYETLESLAKSLNLTIQTEYSRKRHADLIRTVISNPAYDGRTVVICWVHEYLPEMAKELGMKPKPTAWKGKVYDRFSVMN